MKNLIVKEQQIRNKQMRKYEFHLQTENFLVSAKVFSFECPAFLLYVDIPMSRSLSPSVPRPSELFKAIDIVCERGSLDNLALLPCISFFMCADGFNINKDNEHIIYINPSIDVYLTELRKSYSAFFESFNPNNYRYFK